MKYGDLEKLQLFPNLKKSGFFHLSLVYVWYLIGKGELKIDPEKMEVITKWLTPTNVI